MIRKLGSLAVLLGSLALPGVIAPAAAGEGNSISYVLDKGSDYEVGCFGPCMCPVLSLPLKGSFVLTPTVFDGLFWNYAITDVDFVSGQGSSVLRITGSGVYKIGGEFALQQQLSLDLSVGDQPEQHFDSGFLVGGRDFPGIYLSLSVNGFACFDTAMTFRSIPSVVSIGGSGGLFGRPIVQPNPFVERVELQFLVLERGSASLKIYDARGRQVRTVASETPLDRGPGSLVWDGRHDNGADCAAGTYFLQLRISGQDTVHRVVKLR
jgi:hypothetical protein